VIRIAGPEPASAYLSLPGGSRAPISGSRLAGGRFTDAPFTTCLIRERVDGAGSLPGGESAGSPETRTPARLRDEPGVLPRARSRSSADSLTISQDDPMDKRLSRAAPLRSLVIEALDSRIVVSGISPASPPPQGPVDVAAQTVKSIS
jgi:hypothetical protein